MKKIFLKEISIILLLLSGLSIGKEYLIYFPPAMSVCEAVLSDSAIIFTDLETNMIYKSNFFGAFKVITKERDVIYDINVTNDTLSAICQNAVSKENNEVLIKRYILKNDSLYSSSNQLIPLKSMGIRWIDNTFFYYIHDEKIVIKNSNNNLIQEIPFAYCALESKLSIDSKGCFYGVIVNTKGCQLVFDNSYYLYKNCEMKRFIIQKLLMINWQLKIEKRSFVINEGNVFLSYSEKGVTTIFKIPAGFPEKIKTIYQYKNTGRLNCFYADKMLLVNKDSFTILEDK